MDSIETQPTLNDEGIAIIGLTGRFPGARNIDEFWKNLSNGVESISFFSDEELLASGLEPDVIHDPKYVRANGVVDDISAFDAAFFGYTPKEAAMLDPQQRLFLEYAWEVLEQAGYNADTYQGLIGVYAGGSASSYMLSNLLNNQPFLDEAGMFQTILSNDKDFLATRTSYKLNLKGPSISIQTACSTSLVAVHMACQSLLHYECDVALAGGVSISIPQKVGYLYEEEGIASPDGHCRAFDADARGTVGGSGVGVVALKRLADAIVDGDTICAIIRGSAINNDGSAKVGYTAPSVEGQVKVITEAMAMADIKPDSISYIEAHGTGTELGDPIEVTALTQAFRMSTQHSSYCAIGSVKTNIGHLDAASGIAGLIKTVLALQHNIIPPSLHYQRPNPKIDFANSPFYVNTQTKEWKSEGAPRRAGVSSFGIGGTNAHIIVEEAPDLPTHRTTQQQHVVVLSAKTKSALESMSGRLAEHLNVRPELQLSDIAYTLQVGRKSFMYRRTMMVRDTTDLYNLLKHPDPQRVFSSLVSTGSKQVTFLFPGQGSQYVHMTFDLYQNQLFFREQVDSCVEILTPLLRYDLRTVLFPTLEEKDKAKQQLNRTAVTQVALFVVEYALAKLLMHLGVQPQAMVGHSVGEYVAACLAEVFSLEDALHLVFMRGKLMQEMSSGSMLAVSLPEENVCPLLNDQLELAAHNSPALCVVSGQTEAIEQLETLLTQSGVECRRLKTSHAFHSRMMEPALSAFVTYLHSISLHAPTLPYLSNVTGTWITAEQATDPQYWGKHLRQIVRFAESIQGLMSKDGQILIEVGPGQALSTFAKQCQLPGARHTILPLLRNKQDTTPDNISILQKLQQLWLIGVDVAWSVLYDRECRQRVVLPTYPFERQRYWIDPQNQFQSGHTSHIQANRGSDVATLSYPIWMQATWLDPWQQSELVQQRACWLVLADTCDIGTSLVERLQQYNQDTIVVTIGQAFEKLSDSAYIFNPHHLGEYDQLLAVILSTGKQINNIIHAWSITQNELPLEKASFEMAQYLGLYSVIHLAKSLDNAGMTYPMKLFVLSTQMLDVTGEEPLSVAKATILGVSKVLPQEYRNVQCCTIDISPIGVSNPLREACIDKIMSELVNESEETLVAHRGSHRWVQTLEMLPSETKPSSQQLKLRSNGVYLITGGLGQIGLILATTIVRQVPAKLILIGRSCFPPREEWHPWLATHSEQDQVSSQIRQVEVLEHMGAEVMIRQVDVADRVQMQALFAEIKRQYGQIHGVIHAAGSVHEYVFCPIQDSSVGQCEEQFQAKVYGTLILQELLQKQPLDFCLLQSSLSSLLGGLGFAAYAAANIFMDTLVHYMQRIRPFCWQSINWDGWQFSIEEQNSSQTTQTVMDCPITPELGSVAFTQILSYQQYPQIFVSRTNVQQRLEQWIELHDEAVLDPVDLALYARPQLLTPYMAPTNETEQRICVIWQQLLGIEAIGIHDNFFDLGGHSLLGTQLITRLRDTFQVDLSLRILFDDPTVASLAMVIIQKKAEFLDDAVLLQALEQLEHLTDDEVQAMLAVGLN